MQPVSKRARQFSIDYILANQQGNGNENSDRYVERLSNSLWHNAKFNIVKTYSKFLIKDVPNDPESLLSGFFTNFI